MGSRLLFVVLVTVLGLAVSNARAQTISDSLAQPLVIASVGFEGNTAFDEELLRAQVRTAANRRLLGIPGVTWWLWLYKAGNSGTFGKRLGQALVATGEAPALLDGSSLASDAERLTLLYQQEGFLNAQVTAQLDTTASLKIAVTFQIEQGTPTFVRQVAFEGLDALDLEKRKDLAEASLLRPERVDEAQPLAFEVRPQRYSASALLEERRRMLTFLRNQGFAAVTRDSIRAYVTPVTGDSVDIVLQTNLGPRYRFGTVEFEVAGPEDRVQMQADTLDNAAYRAGETDKLVTWQMRNEGQLEADLLTRALQFQPGDWYDQSQLLATKRRLEATGVFTFTDIVAQVPDTARTDSVVLLPHRITVRTRPRHNVRFETFMVQRSGLLSGSDNELGMGAGVTYENANIFGGGESFRINTTGSLAADVDSTLFTSAQAEINTSLTLPYLITPLRSLDRTLDLYQARTRLSLSLLTARREDLRLIIRGRGATRVRLELQHTPTLTSLVDLLDLSLSNPDTLNGFQERFLNRILGTGDSLLVTDPVQRAQILEDYTQPQINNALRYTLRSANVNPLRRTRGYSYEAAVEVGGNLPNLLDRYVYTPDSLEGSLPGLPFFSGDRTSNRLIYRQYIRFVTDLRRYQPLSRRTVFAWKFIGGVAQPTGDADVVPFDRRFYSGGASSVRGWSLRELGPGAASFTTASTGNTTTNILGGDIKLEASAELRNTVLRNALTAEWIVALFADAGNVWFGPRNPGFRNLDDNAPTGRFALDSFYKELGVGTGFGLRIAWEYLIVRFDLAYRVYDPARPDAGAFPNGLRSPIPYFGIGHAF